MSSTETQQPSVDVGVITFDRGEYKRLWMETPLNPPADSFKRRELAPGTCVKTARASLCGRVHKNTADGSDAECIVIGHGWENWDTERFVWKGNHFDFVSLWQID